MIERGMIGIILIALLTIASVQSSPFRYTGYYFHLRLKVNLFILDPTVYEDLSNLHAPIETDLIIPEKRALMRLGKRAYMRLGKRAYLRLGKRAPLRLG